jgi:hypothetical protein
VLAKFLCLLFSDAESLQITQNNFPKETSQESGGQKSYQNTEKILSLLNFCKSSALIP